MLTIQIIRDQKSNSQIQGQLFVINEKADIVFRCFTLELPWKQNKPMVSAIPEGNYKIKKRNSPKYKDHLHILDVKDRSWILIHNANYVRQLNGCIAVGENRIDIDRDGLTDVTNSVATLKKLVDMLPDETFLTISSLN
jgi:hypothetical protein